MEDNILFKSHIVQDLPTYREFNRAYTQSAPSFVLGRMVLILCTLYLCFQMDNLVSVYSYLVLLILWAIIGLIQWIANRGGSIHYKRQLSNNFGKPPVQDFHFTDTAILPVNEEQTLPGGILYNQVRRVIETKKLLILMLPYRQAVLVSKPNLEGGTREQFLAFLRRTCSQGYPGQSLDPDLGNLHRHHRHCGAVQFPGHRSSRPVPGRRHEFHGLR